MQPLTDVFKLEVLDYAPELDEEKKAAFGKYWHGDQAFTFIWLMRKNSRAKSCESCKSAFPRKNPKCGYDLVVVHNERYERPNIGDSGKRFFPIITNQLGRKLHCVKKTVS